MAEHGLVGTESLPIVSAVLRLWGGRFDPDLATARLGVEPTSRYRTGDPTPGGFGRRRRDGWIVHIGPRETLDVAAMLDELRERMAVSAEVVRQTCADLGISPRIYCAVSPTSTLTPGLMFSAEVVAWASALGASIEVDVMLWPDDEDE